MSTELVTDPKQIDPALLKSLCEQSATQAIAELQKSWQTRDNERAEALTKKFTDELNAYKGQIAKIWPTFSLPGTEPTGDPKKDFSLSRAINAIKTGNWSEAGLEREVFAKTRAMSIGVDSAGGFIAPPEVVTAIIQPLRANVAAFKLGARDIGGMPKAEIRMPRQTADVTAQWVAENAPSTLSQPTFGFQTLRPRQLIARTELSNLLLATSSPAADEVVQNSMRKQFELAIDLAFMLGTGANGQPTGISNTQGVGTSTLAGPTYNQLKDFVSVVRVANALQGGKAGWAIHPTKFNAIEKMPDVDTIPNAPPVINQALERRVLSAGPIDTLVGYPFEWTTQLASSGANAAIFGVWEMAYLMRMGGLEILASNTTDTAMQNNTTQIRMVMYGDIGIEHGAAFCVASA